MIQDLSIRNMRENKYRIVVRIVKTKYWTPTDPHNAYRKLRKIINNTILDKSLLFISEKALKVLTGDIYDEARLSVKNVDILAGKIHRIVWCRLLRKYVNWKILNTICNVHIEDISRHIHFTISRCISKLDFISIFKPTSGCGIDASFLPYMYVTDVQDSYVNIIKKLWLDYRHRLWGIVIVDGDLSLICKRGHLILTSRRTYVKGTMNVGPLVNVLSRSFLRKFFLKSMTVVYYVGYSIPPKLIFLLSRRARKYMYNRYGMTLLENVMCLEAENYKTITWSSLINTTNVPMVYIRVSKG